MRKTLTRQQLYDMVWELPVAIVAEQLGLSRISLVRLCRKANIPLPDRRHRGRISLGRAIPRPPLPPRELGQQGEIDVGRGPRYGFSDAELVSRPLPPAPRFEGDEAFVRAQVAATVRDVPLRKTFTGCHREVERLLKGEAVRSARGHECLFDSRIERRRLRMLNALFQWASRSGFGCNAVGPAGVRGSITVRDQAVPFTLGYWGVEEAAYGVKPPRVPEEAPLCFKLVWWQPPPEVRLEWMDEGLRLEAALLDIAREIVFAAEWGYRWRVKRSHEFLVERRTRLEASLLAEGLGRKSA